jgi:2-octaprenyl-6-methoxyphenol hydroxylase
MSARPVAIIGGGPAGLALALALARAGVGCTVIDARAAGSVCADPRVLALSHGSRQVLERLGVWTDLPSTPIRTIHISHAGRFGRTRLSAEECGVDALGYVVAAGMLASAIEGKLAETAVERSYGASVDNVAPGAQDAIVSRRGAAPLRARLAVFAEGGVSGNERIVRRDYGQSATIAIAQPDRHHDGVAYERFTAHGPVALLPYGDAYAVVFVTGDAEAEDLVGLSPERFRERLQERFGERVRIRSVGPRARFALALRYRRDAVGERTVWLGNSAQTLHPVAGQGFNLALRDVWQLAEALGGSPEDPGAGATLSRYAAARRLDRNATIGFTDFLVRVFSNDSGPVAAARGGGLLALDVLPPLRSFVARRMMFGARAWL